MKLCHAAALALVGWYLNSGRSGKGRPNRPARDGNRRERVRAPGKANTPPDASLSQIESALQVKLKCPEADANWQRVLHGIAVAVGKATLFWDNGYYRHSWVPSHIR